MNLDPVPLRSDFDALAPDGSQIHPLARGERASLCQCVLPPHTTSRAIQHKSVEEIWWILSGAAQVWREGFNDGKPIDVNAGTSLVIPPQTAFQYRNISATSLKIAITTSPPWPGDTEAVTATGPW